MHQALYRKWRPQSFEQVCGQEHITNILKYEVSEKLLSHAYLFCGSRGTGKTTCAKILARAVNCENPRDGSPCGECPSCRSILDGFTTDILEMDAASNNKVDDIRTILDEVVYTPSSLKYRVYIIDEVHMLTASAFNALLKTLEEPPAHVIFILATTEMQKLPATIISRCQRFDFRRIAAKTITERLKYIAAEEGIRLDPDAALILARLAQGGMRDAISLFELCSAGGRDVTAQTVSDAVGFTGRGPMSECVRAISARQGAKLFDIVAGVDSSAGDISVFWQELISYYRDILVFKTAGSEAASRYLDLTDSEAEMLAADAALFRPETVSYHCRLLDDAYTSMQRPGANRRTVAELTLIRMCDERLGTSNDALLARISALEAKLASGIPQAAAAAPQTPSSQEAPVPETGGSQHTPSAAPAATASPETVKKASAPAAPAQAKRQLRPLRCWAEITECFRQTSAPVAAMLATEKAYTDAGGNVIILYSKEITKMLAGTPQNLAALASAVSLTTGNTVGTANIVFEKAPAGSDAPSDADILAEELEAMIDK